MQVKLLSVVLGAEIDGINLRDTPAKNFEVINNLLLEHKVLFFRNQNITSEEQIALAKCFAPLERNAYVKCRDKYPEIVRIIKGANEKHQWGETWHIDVSYNVKPTKPIVLRLIKIPSVGGDSMFSNMELAWDTLDEKIKDKIKNKKALHSSLGAAAFLDNYKKMKGNGNIDEYSNERHILKIYPETRKKILFVNSMYVKKIIDMDKEESDEILSKVFTHQERLDFLVDVSEQKMP